MRRIFVEDPYGFPADIHYIGPQGIPEKSVLFEEQHEASHEHLLAYIATNVRRGVPIDMSQFSDHLVFEALSGPRDADWAARAVRGTLRDGIDDSVEKVGKRRGSDNLFLRVLLSEMIEYAVELACSRYTFALVMCRARTQAGAYYMLPPDVRRIIYSYVMTRDEYCRQMASLLMEVSRSLFAYNPGTLSRPGLTQAVSGWELDGIGFVFADDEEFSTAARIMDQGKTTTFRATYMAGLCWDHAWRYELDCGNAPPLLPLGPTPVDYNDMTGFIVDDDDDDDDEDDSSSSSSSSSSSISKREHDDNDDAPRDRKRAKHSIE